MQDPHILATTLADLAVASLIEEVSLTPKPGLVDRIDQGSHDDLTFSMMLESANCLHNTFYNMAMAAYDKKPSQYLREKIGEIGREGEAQMFQVTNGVNTHKGAIWSLGLLTAAAAIQKEQSNDDALCFTAAEIAQYEDRFIPHQMTNGIKAVRKYGVHGAKAEAQLAFPHIRKYSLPVFKASLNQFNYEIAKFHSFLALMANLDDTCLLHRGGLEGLNFAKKYAFKVLKTGDLNELKTMNEKFKERNLSPGGSADLLAATIYLYKISQLVSSPENAYATVN
ncbi:triphosphoribosyl-dephospho-CoA synthase [Lysinibacillus telephonicus]|uniref:triphosphoribosyl-dephospho-CoA synthase n=1 Tax=Lysinibacillus telephonicus TaxID=1714840 RepID=A0A3S0JW46_9BACI|nr:triphosphoribosyl-dephospho-CoA synthase [Lysinibacillus telephonicus]RTQ92492.1 triphosphoribosyl-dephospho-CoA synthase [Lysinibacillus telephonicus]